MTHIAVLIPTFRRPQLVLRAIKSVITASVPGCEVTVTAVDNASPESPIAGIRDAFGNRVKVIVNESNLGMAGNWVRCRDLAQASGADFWMMLEDDNLLEEGFLHAAVAALKEDSSADVFASGCSEFNDHGAERHWKMWSVAGGPLPSGRLDEQELLAWCFTCAMRLSATMIRNTEALKGLPGFEESHFAAMDVSGLGGLCLAARGVRYDSRPLMRYYVNPRSISATAAADGTAARAELLRALRANALSMARAGRVGLESWRLAARNAPIDRLFVAVLATDPGDEPMLTGPHSALVEALVERSSELTGIKRFGSRVLRRYFWKAACFSQRQAIRGSGRGPASDYPAALPGGGSR